MLDDQPCQRLLRLGAGALSDAELVALVAGVGAQERDQAAVLAESGSSVVTSILGQTSFEIKEVMRLLRDGNAGGARSGQIENQPFNGNFPESLQDAMDFLFLKLQNGEIKTTVPLEKP